MQIMGLISEMMGISFGQADIYRRALEKMHKPANKKKVEYFDENCVKLAVKRGIPKEDAEYIKGMILDNCGYAFNKCISGSEKIKLVENQYDSLTIEEMYKIKNDEEFAESVGKIDLYEKFNREGYGKAYSMQDDGRLRLNDIKDIRYSGVKSVYKITTESGDNVKCTLNHSFPTPSGKKLLLELKIGDELYIDAGHEKLTVTSKIVSIEFIGNENVYDVEMANPYHNFAVENGIITGNSHAVCYSYISYYTAYMKVHFPLIFHKTMLNGNLGDFQAFVDLAKDDGVSLAPPHVNYSRFTTEIDFTKEKTLRSGFNIVKGIGADPAADIKACAPYESINDFMERASSKATNKKCVDALIKVGAFDGLGIKYDKKYFNSETFKDTNIKEKDGKLFLSRKQLLRWYELLIESKKQKGVQNYEVPSEIIKNRFVIEYELVLEDNDTYTIPEPMLHIFGLDKKGLKVTRKKPKGYVKMYADENFPVPEKCSKPLIGNIREINSIETSALDDYTMEMTENGFSFAKHPLACYFNKIRPFKDCFDGESIVQAGIVTKIERRMTKTNKEYFWVSILTPHETVRVTIWNNQLKKFGAVFTLNNLVKVKGTKGYGGMSCENAVVMDNRNRGN